MNYLKRFFDVITAPFRVLVAPLRWLLAGPVKIISAPKWFMGITLPTRVAMLLAVALCLLVLTAYIAFFFVKDGAHWAEWMRPGRITLIVALLVTIPLIARQTIRLFLEGSVSAFADIDEAWQAGLVALRKNGLSLTELPVFLVLGVRDGPHFDAIMDAAGMKLPVRAVPDGRKPLRWYASERAVFLACPGTGCLSLTNSATQRSKAPKQSLAAHDPSETLVADGPTAGDDHDLTVDEELNDEDDLEASLMGTLAANLKRTLIPGARQDQGDRASGSKITRDAKEKQTRRLKHICQLLRVTRQPYCSLNGIVTLIPFQTFDHKVLGRGEAPAALQRDLRTLRSTTNVCTATTVLITGMESEQGFLELCRRLGPKQGQARFGKGFDVDNTPNKHNMEALAVHACGAFEDWVYNLFRDRDALTKPGNIQLYGLVCKIRSQLSSHLRSVLTNGFGNASEGTREMLGGLYFAATDSSPDKQWFVRGVLEKAMDLEEEVQWTDKALAEDQRYHRWAQVGMFVNAVIAIVLIGIVVYKFWFHEVS